MNKKHWWTGGLAVVALGLGLYLSLLPTAPVAEAPVTTLNTPETMSTNPTIVPIDHASFVLKWGSEVVYNDPVSHGEAFLAEGQPTLIVITHSHPDHLNVPVLESFLSSDWSLVAPQEVFDKLTPALQVRATVLKNGEATTVRGINITAVPMYNVSPEKTRYHVKGVGNGYVLERDGYRVYNASDTELTDELRAQTGMDVAFLPMNEPYTMSISMAVEAALAIAPKQVYPYHYRNAEGLADIAEFKRQVEAANPNIQVVLADWYKLPETKGEVSE